ncbi:LLM class flavin-dependent oxidoreductase [Brachybacterium sp. DNPG3]
MTSSSLAAERSAALPRFHWFLPPQGDSTTPGAHHRSASPAPAPDSPALLAELTDIALAAEEAGFHGVLTPVGIGCPDPWVVCSAVAARTERLSFIVAFRPSLQSATLLAQQADTFRRIHGGRLILNVVTGGNPSEQAGYGVHAAHDERYEITDEALRAIGPLLHGERVDLQGSHLRLVGAELVDPSPQPVPIFFGGASPKALEVAADHADTYLLWGEPLAQIAERIARVRAVEHDHGRERTLRLGLRIHVIARESAEEAWDVARAIQSSFDPAAVAEVQARLASMDSVGQARMGALHGESIPSDVADLVIGPNLWSGIGLVREGVGTALVGSYDEVAERLAEYADLGIDEFILPGYPHREEALRVGAHVVPRVQALTSAGRRAGV